MKRIPGLGLAVLFLAVQSAVPQTVSSTVTRDPQAVAAVQTALSNLGSVNQSAPTSIVASGTYTSFASGAAVSSPLTVEALGFDQFRWEVDTPDQGTFVTIVSGTTGSRQSSQETDAIPLGQIPGTTFETFPVLALAQWVSSSNIGLTMIGTETIGGQNLLHISITPTLVGNTDANLEKIYETTHQREIYLDPQTMLPVRLRYYSHSTDWRTTVPIDLVYSNFQSVNGVLFPLTVTRYSGNQILATIQYQSIVLNSSLNPSDFTVEVTQ